MRVGRLKDSIVNQKGMTLIEILISLSILAVIIVPFFTMFTHTAFVINKSAITIDATYVAQRVMEEAYNDSQDETVDIPPDGIEKYWDAWYGNYWIHREISAQNDLVRVLVKVYTDDTEQKLEAQMETYFMWK